MLDSERAARFAAQLKNNALLPEILSARANEIRDDWEAADTPEKREQCWLELTAINNFKDFLYARIDELTRREPTE